MGMQPDQYALTVAATESFNADRSFGHGLTICFFLWVRNNQAVRAVVRFWVTRQQVHLPLKAGWSRLCPLEPGPGSARPPSATPDRTNIGYSYGIMDYGRTEDGHVL
jgi:hypothetical protein